MGYLLYEEKSHVEHSTLHHPNLCYESRLFIDHWSFPPIFFKMYKQPISRNGGERVGQFFHSDGTEGILPDGNLDRYLVWMDFKSIHVFWESVDRFPS